MTRTRTAIVIGGGVAGPVAAIALRKAGIEATVYEAYDSTADGIGGGMSIAPNGLDALGALGATEAVARIGEPITGMVLQSWTGKRLGEFGPPAHLPAMQFVWRPQLYRALYEEAVGRGVEVVHGKRLTGVRDDGDGVSASFADGTEVRADVLLGADGIRSTVRALIDPDAPAPRHTGLLGFGAANTHDMTSTGGKMHMVFGKRAFFGYQVYDDGTGGWFANLPHPPMTAAQAREVGGQEWLRVLRAAFADDRGPAQDMLRQTGPEDLLVTGPLEDIPAVPRWSRGRIVLLGDAAHPTSPSSGQGASLAMESAVQLARCLRDLPHDEAFATFESMRRERVERIIAAAARTNSDKAAGFLGRILRDALLPLMFRFAKPERTAWQFEHHIDWDAPVAGVQARV